MENEITELDKIAYELFIKHFIKEYGHGHSELGDFEPLPITQFIEVGPVNYYYEQALLIIRNMKIKRIRNKI